jgi:ribosomal protection tetracycline resistance protein
VRILNLGIVAHVDAGKTSLTERLLYAAGVIDQIGRVDDGSTQTDSLALERQRGITIKSAVASFAIGDVTVNLIDTPGHPDFIAEVERALRVLDGAVLVISAVEGVQAQTRVLLRTLRRLRVPTLIFVNKIDRAGARHDSLLRDIAERLTPAIVPMGSVDGLGTRAARYRPHAMADEGFAARLVELLAERDDALLAAYVHDGAGVPSRRLGRELAAQSAGALVYPVFFGSAATGAGVDSLMTALTELLPAAGGDPAGPMSGTVFKVERGPAGEKIAYVRMFSGAVHVRDRLRLGSGTAGGTGGARRDDGGKGGRDEEKVTAIGVVEGGSAVPRPSVAAGQIGKLWGLRAVRIGDTIGVPRAVVGQRHLFAPPTLETVVVARDPAGGRALHAALSQLAEQDPLINLRQDDLRQELSVSLYGEVQKEVIQATLADEYGIDVTFRETTTVYLERPLRTGTAVEYCGKAPNPFVATIGLRVEPAPVGSGLELRLDVAIESIPLYLYKQVEEFRSAIEETVRGTLRQGLSGWQVDDCLVTVTHCGYQSPITTARDFRRLTPLVLMTALSRAGTVVCEPIHRFSLDGPADTLGATLGALARLGASPETQAGSGPSYALTGLIPAARVRDLEERLPALTRGEGTLEYAFDHYRPVHDAPPTRPRWDDNPLDRKEYLLRVERRIAARRDGTP